jgi:hypothetical protein
MDTEQATNLSGSLFKTETLLMMLTSELLSVELQEEQLEQLEWLLNKTSMKSLNWKVELDLSWEDMDTIKLQNKSSLKRKSKKYFFEILNQIFLLACYCSFFVVRLSGL